MQAGVFGFGLNSVKHARYLGGPDFAELGRSRTQIGPSWARLDLMITNLGAKWPNFGRHRPAPVVRKEAAGPCETRLPIVECHRRVLRHPGLPRWPPVVLPEPLEGGAHASRRCKAPALV